jgi:hypothetical protein
MAKIYLRMSVIVKGWVPAVVVVAADKRLYLHLALLHHLVTLDIDVFVLACEHFRSNIGSLVGVITFKKVMTFP